MPDKICGKGCLRCWHNKLNHGSKLKKKMFPKHFEFDDKENKEQNVINDDKIKSIYETVVQMNSDEEDEYYDAVKF
jgi:hypothetical protein